MCEFNIKWGDNHNADSEKDRRGCYKHGYIINVQPDGEYEGKTNHTVLKVPGLSVEKVRKLMEFERRPVPFIEDIPKEDYDSANTIPSLTVCDVEYTNVKSTPMGQLTTIANATPKKVGDKDFYAVTGMKLDDYRRRRFRLPQALMDAWFPTPGIHKTLTKTELVNAVKDIYDSRADTTIDNVSWKQAFLNDIGA